ncbi:TetR family transcriptional regulator [Microbacterium paludicola]|uniref:TetR family transcriptional regulator n=1 Tax=Microbacterium paludicola TaxID=300019 RepID=UPI00387949EC
MESRDARPVMERNTRDGIIDTALRLLEETGLPDLSMRRLAGAIGVQPSALYWHFENKQSLLAAVADRIVGAAGPAPTTGDRAADVTAAAVGLRDALLSHRDGAEVVLSTQALGLGSEATHRRLAQALGGGDAAASAATVLLQFILGHASLVQQRIQAARFGAYPQDEADVVATTSADFSAGVRMILAGLDATG